MLRSWAAVAGLTLLAAMASAGDWTSFRGPSGSGVSEETKLPVEWGPEKNIAWKVKVPGVAWSCPVVWGDKVFVTTAISDKQVKPKPGMGGFGGDFKGGFGKDKDKGKGKGKFPGGGGKGGFGKDRPPPDAMYTWQVHCLDRTTGKLLWKETAIERKPTIATHSTNTYASETPIVDGERVYAYFGMTGVFCFDLKGKMLWKKDLGSYKMMFSFGTGSSPALDSGRLFIQCDNEEKAFLVALDAKTGDEKWRVERPNKSGWSTPLVWKTKSRTEVVCAGGNKVCSYDPATGKLLWELTGLTGQFNASPIANEETLFVGCGGMFGPQPLVAVKAGASGTIALPEEDRTHPSIAWVSSGSGPSMASPLLYQGHIYILEQRGGAIRCVDATTGKLAYRQRLSGARGFTSSPWAYDGKVFCLDEDGQTFVLEAGPKYKFLGKNTLSEMFWSSPAVTGGAVYLRGVDHLYCIRQ